jgi:hypothetical protein
MNFSRSEPGQHPAWSYAYNFYFVILHVVVTYPKTPSDLFLNSRVGSYTLLGTAQSTHK